MLAVNGKWYDGNTSLQTPARLSVFDNGAVQIDDRNNEKVLLRQNQLLAKISDRLADTPRFLTFPNGCTFETEDNLAIDNIVNKFSPKPWNQWLHLLESRKRYVLMAFAAIVLFMLVMVTHGIPMAANMITNYLPRSYYELADQQALKALNRLALNPSDLNPSIEKRIRDNLQASIDMHAHLKIKLLIKKGGRLGANAFALPGGTIVFTDELVKIAENDDELIAILAHEIGHVAHRHGMRRMVQDSLLSVALMALTGDASGVAEIFLGLPVILTELAYSREFEQQADQYALNYLLSQNITTKHFAEILMRIDTRSDHQQAGKRTWLGYLATHPPTSERIKLFRRQVSTQ